LSITPRRASALGFLLRGNPVTAGALILFAAIVLTAAIGPLLLSTDPLATHAAHTLEPPSRTFWFGTDEVGRDVFSRVIVAARLDLAIALSAVAISFAIGGVAGAASGFLGGWFDRVMTRLVDTLMAFPLFLLAMAIISVLGNNTVNVVYATAIVNLPFYIRMARAEAARLRSAGFLEAARLGGSGRARVLFAHVYPNILPPMMVQVSLNLGWAILNAAGLSFIGLGVRPPTPEWGIMVADGAADIVSGAWWVSLFPGLALMLTVFCFNLIGDGLRDLLDPRLRR
jgi:peptide/nickel transport system permease protein